MATIGTGYRTVNDLLIEVSYSLVEPIVKTALTGPVAATGPQTVTVASTDNMYVGAQLVVDSGTPREAITLTAVTPGVSITAVFAKTHLSGAILSGATFPTQYPTDPLYTQAEMLGYLSRAQNEFLAKVPVVYALFQQTAVYGHIFQPTPPTAIEIQRIAASSVFIELVSLVRSGNVVTATTVNPHGLAARATPYVSGTGDSSFVGTFEIATILSPTSFTYPQVAADRSTTGGVLLYWLRLYEYTQEEMTQQYRQWRNAYIGEPSAWFEDRAGLYQFGLNGKPASNFPLQLLCSIRDSDSLGYGDSFLTPDLFLHFVKYKMLEYVFSKDGVQSDPIRVGYCAERFNKGVAASLRWIGGMQQGMGG